ncbi:hypothetical protein RI844_00035 [Thalassotalea fonticola]|uniref:GIY-YIG nuclease family protein n=1 Tax=Thalassotalea fonticola TaxID=3065649 RepID=A0ABZ0GP24_9GAMM|nr:hypothetical protein RI844_20225 [Colwelliaceae bacterium S1-1]WOH37667.1 hypothetical protein RI844_00035 [Colwelliaceae bacterium S1-1]
MWHMVYKIYGKGHLLYVGEGSDVDARVDFHSKNAPWFKEADWIKECWLPNKEVAVMYETYLINTEKPSENKQKNNNSDMSIVTFDEDSIMWLDGHLNGHLRENY